MFMSSHLRTLLTYALHIHAMDRYDRSRCQTRLNPFSPVLYFLYQSYLQEVLALSGADPTAAGDGPVGAGAAAVACCHSSSAQQEPQQSEQQQQQLQQPKMYTALIAQGAVPLHIPTEQPGCSAAADSQWEWLGADATEAAQAELPLAASLPPPPASSSSASSSSQKPLPLLPTGMGICRHLLAVAATVAVTVAAVPCCEGDNTPEAALLAGVVAQALQLLQGESDATAVQWTAPMSWGFLYGAAAQAEAMW
jgi:hypothetical protein